MTKEELFTMIRQTKKDNEVTVTWVAGGKVCCRCVREVKVNLSRNRVELFLGSDR